MNKERIIRWRQDLHQIPELELDLPETTAYLLAQLAPLGCTLSRPLESAVLAYFDFGRDRTIAFRADMDGLPVTENSRNPEPSVHPGRMHACGHDGHMAILLGLAHELDKRETAPVNVLLIFQPGEENPGGARLLTEKGVLDFYGVDCIFGLHLWPALEKGVLATRPGPMMARSSEVDVTFAGMSVHAARYKEGHDALEAAASFVQELYAYEKTLPSEVPRLLRFGRLEAGAIRNVVADHALVQGTLRAFEPAWFDRMKQAVTDCAAKQEARFGVQASVSFSQGYPPLSNDAALAGQILSGLDVKRLEVPDMASEDFSWYLQQVPGVFFFLGTGSDAPLHAADFDFDPAVCVRGVRLFLDLVDMAGQLAV